MSRVALWAIVAFLTLPPATTSCSDQNGKGGEVMKHGRKNALANERSPYLLQHAENPVDWHPWGKKAFEKAKRENKPVFLSIGYSTCHWCHVMERESFEDEEVADLLNEHFVSVKVDREERPDVDAVYMDVCQMMTGGGGWPMTIVMTPDKKPFYAATYIPKTGRFGRPGLMELLPRIADLWENHPDKIDDTTKSVLAALRQNSSTTAGNVDPAALPKAAFEELRRRFDPELGGFGGAPKFPSPHQLVFLIWYAVQTGDQAAMDMVETTLTKMRLGGIHDHVGHGFHRYSTDAAWHLPHFEKMLYDQALLTIAYTEAWRATGETSYADTVRDILRYVARDMTAPEGGFYSAEDADSEGEEGKFYLWTFDELKRLLTNEELTFLQNHFGISESGNVHDEATGQPTGKNILHLRAPLSPGERDVFEKLSSKLNNAREKRVHPFKDTKILADWNGLMIKAFANAGVALDEPKYVAAAAKAADFVLAEMTDERNRLWHRHKDGENASVGKLDDYAFMTAGLLELYEATYEPRYLAKAIAFAKVVSNHFRDEKNGAFFMTPDFGEKLIVRPKTIQDGAVPSGNSESMLNFLRLAEFTGNTHFEKMAADIEDTYAGLAAQAPTAFTRFISGVLLADSPSRQVVIVVDELDDKAETVLREIRNVYDPFRVTVMKTAANGKRLAELIPFTKNQKAIDGKPTVYICENFSCKQPMCNMDDIKIAVTRERPPDFHF